MMRRIAAEETADVILLGSSARDNLAQQGKVVVGSKRAFSRCGVGGGVAVSADPASPDISTVDGLKHAILAALIEQLGIAREVQAKALRSSRFRS